MDVSNASYYISNEKKKNKDSQMGHTKKLKKKKKKSLELKHRLRGIVRLSSL
jgi:hypothetical protein